jgi:ABC-type lipoprotein export system ATPase subunit
MISNDFAGYLICDARCPLISGGLLREETILYNIPPASLPDLLGEFLSLTGKALDLDSPIAILSGGQKVLLMCLLALYSPAKAIIFADLWHSLDEENRARVGELIQRLGSGKEIVSRDSSDAD